MTHATSLPLCALTLALAVPASGQDLPEWMGQKAPGFWGRTAPEWRIEQWFQLPEGKKRLRLADLRGKVVYLFCFQSWCPGCHETGFPTLKKTVEHYRGRDDIAFVAVQTVFEGAGVNTLDNARKTAAKYGLKIPFGHDATPRGSTILKDYHTLGTPWVVVIDRQGKMRYSMWGLPFEQGVDLIDRLLEPRARNKAAGKPVGALDGLHWLGERVDPGKSRYTLYRFWTDGCPFCRASLPDLARLEKDIEARAGKGFFDVVAVYHQKRRGEISDDELRDYLAEVGYRGAAARDPQWRILRRLMQQAGFEDYTSVSFLVDQDGRIVWAHEGPRLHRSEEFPKADAAMRELEGFLAWRLGQTGKKPGEASGKDRGGKDGKD